MTEPQNSLPCADCATMDSPTHLIRKRPLCTPCFTRYINSKILKRMESYRIKNSSSSNNDNAEKKRLFLPLSGGVSSLVLLSVLHAQLQKQMAKQGRKAYELVVCCVDLMAEKAAVDELGDALPKEGVREKWFEGLKWRFGGGDAGVRFLGMVNIVDVFLIESELVRDLAEGLGLVPPSGMRPDYEYYEYVMRACSTATTRGDVQQIILDRFLVAMAKHNDCSSILYGHSDSRLAAMALADVAKGRGGAVPADTADGFNAALGVGVNYPARDLFKSELELYAHVQEPSLATLLAPEEGISSDSTASKPPISVKSMSIDDLLTGYITSQGEKYPSIMANVVRTAGKLRWQEPGATTKPIFCRLCRGTILPNNNDPSDGESSGLCYACTRMKQEIKIR